MTAPTYPGELIEDAEEMLRRVAPAGKAFLNKELPSGEAFKPSEPGPDAFKPGGRNSRDNGGLSTKRQVEHPETSYWAYLKSANPAGSRSSIGTWGFLVEEAKSLSLPAYADGGLGDLPRHHSTVWFPMPEDLSRTKLKLMHDILAEDLRDFALEHKCLFRPVDPHADARSLMIAP